MSATSGMRRNTGNAQLGASPSIAASGSDRLSSVNSGCDNSASPTHEGATIRILLMAVRNASVRRFCGTPYNIARAAIRTQSFPIAAEGQEHARMRVPQRLRRQRTMQRQVRRRNVDYFESVAVG